MTMPFKERVANFCARFDLDGEWEELQFGTSRMSISFDSEQSFHNIWRHAKAIRDAVIDHWTVSKEGVCEGFIYIMDQHDVANLKASGCNSTENTARHLMSCRKI